MKELTGISIAAIQKLLDQLIQRKYVERGEKNLSVGPGPSDRLLLAVGADNFVDV